MPWLANVTCMSFRLLKECHCLHTPDLNLPCMVVLPYEMELTCYDMLQACNYIRNMIGNRESDEDPGDRGVPPLAAHKKIYSVS